MSTTQCHLPKESLAWLQDLIRANIDGREAFQEAAANVQADSALATIFSRLARQRGAHVDELQDLVACNEELPHHTGSLSGAAHRIWIDLRAAFGGGDAAMLAEAERGEAGLLHHYEEAIEALQDCECISALRRQYAAVKTSFEKLQILHEECQDGTRA
jgi:uncharacterized protein (TIGR02284 family)